MAAEPIEHSRAVYVISVAAELAGVHPQTLRIYERKGLLDPARTAGGSRRYSDADIDRCGASTSSPTRASTWPASSGCSSSRPSSSNAARPTLDRVRVARPSDAVAEAESPPSGATSCRCRRPLVGVRAQRPSIFDRTATDISGQEG